MEKPKNDIQKWELLDSEYLIKRPWLTARKDKLRLPSGVVMNDYYVLEYPDWINVIAITKEGKFLFERQYRHGLQQVCYEICAGCVENGEDPMDAAKRELLEETGYAGGEWTHFMTISANPGTMTNLCYTYLALGVEPVDHQHLESTEDIAVHLLTMEEVKQLLQSGEVKQALMAAALWKYFAENRLF